MSGQQQPRACTNCSGTGGHSITAPGTNGATITTWRTCTGCSGTGVRGGGI
ncbi:hypothetical protein [Streptomyces sp. B21-083]|uniref:hypothetical protein n=1 Tax=Streptomyces sp. B21-083 TaxID=3039410 RepID=UPI002FEFCBA4